MSESAPLTFFDKVRDDHVITRLGDDADLLQTETLRQMLLLGVDEIALTLVRCEEIDRFRATDRERRPWAYI